MVAILSALDGFAGCTPRARLAFVCLPLSPALTHKGRGSLARSRRSDLASPRAVCAGRGSANLLILVARMYI